MAAAVIPLVSTVLTLLQPVLPSLILSVEHLFGHSSITGTKNGPSKLATVASIAKTLLTDLANVGIIPSAPVLAPELDGELVKTINSVTGNLKASGLLGPPSLSITPTSSQNVGAGMGLLKSISLNLNY